MASLEELQQENEFLKKRLAFAQMWMARQVQDEAYRITKKRTMKMKATDRDDFLRENQTENISNRINSFFGGLLLMNAPKQTVEFLVDSEVAWYNLSRTKGGDGITVISSYNKILDLFIESFIVAQFRKFAIKKGANILRTNDPLEKSLHLVITKKYILSTGRLYALLSGIRKGTPMYEYARIFREYLDKYDSLGRFLLSDAFFLPFEAMVNSEVFGSKRHEGKISLEETEKTRTILTGNFVEKNGLFHQFLMFQALGGY